MLRLLLSMLLVAVAFAAGSPLEHLEHFDLLASYEPPERAGAAGAVAVTFRALDPDVRLNEKPAPRLQLDLTQDVLVDRQPPAPRRVPTWDPLTAEYLDLAEPVRFPVAISPTAPAGTRTVEAEVVFFYCSVREAWCRRGTADVEVEVTVP
jgi:hypothetical protein